MEGPYVRIYNQEQLFWFLKVEGSYMRISTSSVKNNLLLLFLGQY